MSGGGVWRGNWKVRLDERIHARGFPSLTAFAETRPAVPFYLLAEELGEDIAGVQVLSGLLLEAEHRRHVTRFVRDVLVREFAESLPEGWPSVLDDANRFKIAEALGPWIAEIPETHKDRARQVRTALLATPPPTGWRPLSSEDELLRALLPDEEV